MWYVIGYLIIAVLWYGVDFAAWQRSYPNIADTTKEEDRRDSLLKGILWPLSIPPTIIFIIFDGKVKFHGIKFK